MARYLGPDLGESGPVPSLTPRPAAPGFDHYDEWGQPIDTNGDVMQVGFGTTWAPPPTADLAPPEETSGPEQPAPEPAPVAPPVDSGGAGGGGGGSTPPPYLGGADNPFAPWGGDFTAPTPQPLPDAPWWDPAQTVPTAPTFTPPTFTPPPAFGYDDFSYGDFVAPSVEQAMASPGYQFRLEQGSDRLQNAASARGTLNDSGTLKALMDYGQEAASQEYQNVWNRDYNAYGTNRQNALDQYTTNRGNAVDTYNTNYRTQYQDPYTASYQAAKDQFAPQMTQYDALVASGRDLNQAKLLGYSTNAANVQHLNDTANTNAWNDYLLGYQDYENRRSLATNFALGS